MATSPHLNATRPVTRLDSVRLGVFFTPRRILPRGRHKLSREQVLEAQRERLLVAMTELLAARGYRGFGAGDVARRAGVSLAAFYRCFANKDECVFAGYDRVTETLLARIRAIEIAGKDRPALVKEVLRAFLEMLESDLVVARAYQLEIDALGAPARERRRDALDRFAAHIRDLVTRTSGDAEPPDLPWTAYLGVVVATRQLAADALDIDVEPDLVALVDDLEIWLSDLFRHWEPGGER